MADDLDVRVIYGRTLSWVADLMRRVGPDLLEAATPCPEFTIRALMGHLLGTAERAVATAQGRPTTDIPHVITDVPDGALASRYAVLGSRLREVWTSAALKDTVHAPWGTVTREQALWGFATETLVHGWDLATAVGEHGEAPPELAGPILDRASTTVPAHGRKQSYAKVVAGAPGAGPTELLANWLGHHR